jgi:hypothetical protein
MLETLQNMLGRLLAASPVIVGALGCASPTLPLPPPLAPTITAGPDVDHVTLTAACNVSQRNSVMLIINENPAVPGSKAVGGALTDNCGGWTTVVYAHSGDRLDITYLLNLEQSLPTTVQVP